MESKCPLLIRLWGLRERRELLVGSGDRGGAPAENGLISADRLCSQQVTANSSPFRPEKWGTRAAQPRRGPGGYRGGGPMKMIFASTAGSLYSLKYK